MSLTYVGTSDVTASATLSAANSNLTGTATAGSAVEVPLGGRGTLAFQVAGTYVGQLVVQVTVDATNWATITNATAVSNLLTGALAANPAANATGQWVVDVAGAVRARVTLSSYTSGSPTVSLNAAVGQALVGLDAPLPAGSNALGSVSISGTPNVTANPPASSAYILETAASTNAAVIKATSGHLYQLTIANVTSTAAFVKLYNKASAPTVGTDTPVTTLPIPASTTTVFMWGQIGLRFTTGIAIAVTAAAIKTDTAVTVAGIQIDGSYL